MIFVQLFLYNFLSHTHIIFLFYLFLFLSPLFLTNKKKEQQRCPKNCTRIVVQISLLFSLTSLGLCGKKKNFIKEIISIYFF